ncbi:unnamed protein product [Macrosiphum euphorbiae]|uniref:Uncharacterized protein n=1 Tax=Macrosiphum euphorbiae TaxID=13131 RepID=A0AAV0VEP9_9HEMI|nr:unnamed protein product [Macrosiphum euphorbiae]
MQVLTCKPTIDPGMQLVPRKSKNVVKHYGRVFLWNALTEALRVAAVAELRVRCHFTTTDRHNDRPDSCSGACPGDEDIATTVNRNRQRR